MTENEFIPYIGPRPFEREKEDADRFFGRSHESQEIISLIFGHPITLVYAQSGAGKTSLFNASITPKLEENRFDVLPLTRVSGGVPEGITLQEIKNLYIFNALLKLDSKADPRELLTKTLSEFLKMRDRAPDESGQPCPQAIVFDQFEEIFTYTPENWSEQRNGFFRQVVEALDADPLLRVVFVIREDFLAELDPYARDLPERLRIRYRLERLGEGGALRAIKDPIAKTSRKFADGVAEALVDQLLTTRAVGATGKMAEIEGQYVEPVQLQVVCVKLWSKLGPDVTEIQHTDLKDFKVSEALSDFYESSIRDAARQTKVPIADLRNWFEKTLITPLGTRNTVFREENSTGDIDNKAVDFLEGRHIIRSEFRAGARWYELTHDLLVVPILASNQKWLENLSPLQRQAALWKDENRKETLLLRDKALIDAEVWAGAHQDELTDVERDFLKACRIKQAELKKELEEKEKLAAQQAESEYNKKLVEEQTRSLQRARIYNAIALGLTAIAIVATFFAYSSRQYALTFAETAQTAEADAITTKEDVERKLAQVSSGQLATYALDKLSSQPDLAILLSLEADKLGLKADPLHPNLLARNALLTTLQENAHVRRFLTLPSTSMDSIAFNPKGNSFAVLDDSGVTLWDLDKNKIGGPYGGTPSAVYSVTFSPDGKILASGSKDGSLILWDGGSGEQLSKPLTEHSEWVNMVSISPDGTLMASASDDQSVLLWDISDPKNPVIGEPITGFDHCFASAVFNPDEKKKTLATSRCGIGEIVLWDVSDPNNPQEIDRFEGQNSSVYGLAFSPDGTKLASASKDENVVLWDISKQPASKISMMESNDSVYSVDISPDGRTLASGNQDGSVNIWDISNPNVPTPISDTLYEHSGTVNSLHFSPDGSILASVGFDGKLILWDAMNWSIVSQSSVGTTGPINSVSFNPNGDMLATGFENGSIVLWDISDKRNPVRIEKQLEARPTKPYRMEFSRNGDILTLYTTTRTEFGSEESDMLVDAVSHEVLGIGQVKFEDSEGKFLIYQLYGDNAGGLQIDLFDNTTGRVVGNPIQREFLSITRDGKMLVYQSKDEETGATQLHLWDIAAKTELPTFILGEEPAFSPNGQILIYQTTNPEDGSKFINLWDIAGAKNIGQPIQGVFEAISPDSKIMIYNTPDPETYESSIVQWDIAEARPRGQSIPYYSLSVSANGEFLEYQSYDRVTGISSINLLDISTGKVSRNLGNGGDFLTLSPDGQILFYQTYDTNNSYVNTLDTRTGNTVGKPIIGNLAIKEDGSYKIFQAGRVLAYEVENYNYDSGEYESNLAFIDTLTVSQVGVVISNGSYLAQTKGGKVLLYQTIVNKINQINLLDTTTDTLIGEPIRGKYLSVSSDGNTLVLRNESGLVIIRDLSETWPLGAPVTEAPENVSDAVLSLDGETLAWIGKDGTGVQDISSNTMLEEPFNNHFGKVNSVLFNPDGKSLVAKEEDGSIAVWDFTVPKQLGNIQAGTNDSVLISNDGETLLTVDYDNNTTIFRDFSTSKQIQDAISGSYDALSPDGPFLAIGNYVSNTTTLWNLNAHLPIGQALPGYSPFFSPDGRTLAIGDSNNNVITFWNSRVPEKIGLIPGYYGTFTSDGRVFANYDTNGTTSLWDLNSFKQIGKPFQGPGTISPNGKYLTVSSNKDNKITLWNVSDMRKPVEFDSNTTIEGSYTQFNSSGNLLATYKYNYDRNANEVSLWSLDLQNKKINLINSTNSTPLSESDFAFSPTGDVVAYDNGDGIVLWDEGTESNVLKYPGTVSGMTFNKGGDILAVYGNKGVILWDVNKKVPVGDPLPGSPIPGTRIILSPEGRMLASFASDGIVLRNLETNEDIQLRTGGYSGQLTGDMSFYSNGTRFVALGDDGTILDWNVKETDGEPIIPEDNEQPLKENSGTLTAFSPDGKYLAFAGGSGLNIWNNLERMPYAGARNFPSIQFSVGAITFSSDGRLMAYGDGPNVLIWNVQTKKAEGDALQTGSNYIIGLSLVMDNATPRYLVTVDESNATQIWDWATRTKIGKPMSGNLRIAGFNSPEQVVFYVDSKGRLIKWKWSLEHSEWVDLLCPIGRRNFTLEEWKLYFADEIYPTSNELLTCPSYPPGQ